MDLRDDFWGVFALPWNPANRVRYGLAVLALPLLVCAVMSIVFAVQGNSLPIVFWLGAAVLGVVLGGLLTAQYRLIERRLRSRAASAGSDARLESDCIVVNGLLQSPGVARLLSDRIVLMPLVGQEVSVPLADVSDAQLRHYYNGTQYWGDNAYFKLAVRGRSARLGFAVSHPDRWKQHLCVSA